MVRTKLTQAMDVIVNDMVDETASSLHDVYGDVNAWETVYIKDTVLDLVTRISSRVFLGRNLCRNKRWLHIAKNYTVQIFIATQLIQMLPRATRPFLRWVIPQYRASVRSVRDARKLINPEVERLGLMNQAEEEKKNKKEYTAITWLREVAKGREIDFAAAQMLLSLNAIHTTGEVLTQAMVDICEFPGVVGPLRQEIVRVIGQHGWSKKSLGDLELMDSFLRESQRHQPMGIATMIRLVEKDITLSDGTLLPAGTGIKVLSNCQDLATFAADPDEFKPWRFFDMRQQPGQQDTWNLVTPGKTHLLFGYGKHACPGRFFATLTLKIALCYLLLKYDWQFLPGTSRPAPITFGDGITVSDKARFQCRRRQEEFPLEIN